MALLIIPNVFLNSICVLNKSINNFDKKENSKYTLSFRVLKRKKFNLFLSNNFLIKLTSRNSSYRPRKSIRHNILKV